jgi:hypothetical protein
MKLILLLSSILIVPVILFAQGLSPEKRVQDSIEFSNFKKNNPDLFKSTRFVKKTNDGSTIVPGYMSVSLRLQNQSLADSAYFNFHPGMPDTSTLTPYVAINVYGEKTTISLLSYTILSSSNFQEVTFEPVKEVPAEFQKNGGRMGEPNNNGNPLWVRMSLNGKPLGDWERLDKYPYSIYKESAKMVMTLMSNKKDTFGMGDYTYNFTISTISLNINDQLLIEVKDTKKNWMLERFNITRITPKPVIALIMHDPSSARTMNNFIEKEIAMKDSIYSIINSSYTGWEGNGILQTDNETLLPDTRLALYFRKPARDYPDSSLEYKLTGDPGSASAWQHTGHLILLDKQKPGISYTLWARYKGAPDNISMYRFFVPPPWYQSSTFKKFTVAGGCLLFSATLFVLYSYRSRSQRGKMERLTLEMRSVRSQLNPHFIFNALSSIQGLINKNEIGRANQYLAEFGDLMRDTLNNSEKEMINLATEIQATERYLKIEQLRFRFNFKVINELDAGITEIPTLLLQPLVENAVKHGVAGLNEKGLVEIRFIKELKDLLITISDNGKGFENTTSNNGHGLRLTAARIKLLNQLHPSQPIELKFVVNEKGTSADLLFKNWL